jgi:ATP-dependent protease HslVU (ClpYQ) peptidase subunit
VTAIVVAKNNGHVAIAAGTLATFGGVFERHTVRLKRGLQ